MNKQDLITVLAEKGQITKKQAGEFLAAYQDVITETLSKGEEIKLVGYGTYSVKERAERTGRNPKTGEEITIPASNVPSFKFSKAVKDAVAGK